jgi:hypothetical protein
VTGSPAAAAASERRRFLEPTERFSEILFGLIMVLTFTGSLSAAESGRAQIRTMLIGAIGCNLAWGIVDAIMYILNCLGSRGGNFLTLRRVRGAAEPGEAHALIADAMPPAVAATLGPEDFERVRRKLAALPEPPKRVPLKREDFLGAMAAFLFVFLSTFPVVIPFLLFSDTMRALRFSNLIAIVLLFLAGYQLAKSSGLRPWLTGLVMVVIGMALVGMTIALGG